MKNKKVLILTGITDMLHHLYGDDASFKDIFDMTLPSMQRYAKKHDYDLLAMRSFGTDDHNIFLDDHLGFLRVLRAFEMLQHYDIVMWIDADSIVTNDNYSIMDFELDENHCFYASWDWESKGTFSTGNFIIQKNNYSQVLFDQFVLMGKEIISRNMWGQEQTTLNLLYQHGPMRNLIKVLDHKYLGSVPSIELYPPPVWSDRTPPPFPWTEDSFLCHLTGLSNTTREQMLKAHFAKFL